MKTESPNITFIEIDEMYDIRDEVTRSELKNQTEFGNLVRFFE